MITDEETTTNRDVVIWHEVVWKRVKSVFPWGKALDFKRLQTIATGQNIQVTGREKAEGMHITIRQFSNIVLSAAIFPPDR